MSDSNKPREPVAALASPVAPVMTPQESIMLTQYRKLMSRHRKMLADTIMALSVDYPQHETPCLRLVVGARHGRPQEAGETVDANSVGG